MLCKDSKRNPTSSEKLTQRVIKILNKSYTPLDFEYLAGILGYDTALVFDQLFKEIRNLKIALNKKKIIQFEPVNVVCKERGWTIE